MQVTNQQQINLGTVSQLVDTGANHVLVVDGDKQHWVPFIEPYLVKVDKSNSKIIVDWDPNF